MSFELARALRDLCCLPCHAGLQFINNRQLLREVRADLATEPLFAPDDRALRLPSRPLCVFVSCAEASGETHAVNWVRAFKQILAEHGAPAPVLRGLGGQRLAAEGVEIIGDPVSDARMGFSGVLGALPFYLRLLGNSADEFLSGRVDLFLGVDSPALNVPLGHLARRAGMLSAQYITPQYWGWAPWRVAGFKRAFDLALSILPFEPAWFQRHGVAVQHVGHPQVDAFEPTAGRQLEDRDNILAILPGSRRSVIARNLPSMLESIETRVTQDGNWRAIILQGSDEHHALIESCCDASRVSAERIEISNDLDAGLLRAKAALSVSGTILTHLLHHRIPTVVLYRLEGALQEWMGKHFLTVPYFSSVNLLAGREVFPEFSFASGAAPAAFGAAVLRLLDDGGWRSQCAGALESAARRLGPPGANRRAAVAILDLLGRRFAPQGPWEEPNG